MAFIEIKKNNHGFVLGDSFFLNNFYTVLMYYALRINVLGLYIGLIMYNIIL